MQVALISVYESIMTYGLRCLSAVLKEAKIPTRMIFLPRETEGYRREGFQHEFSNALLDQIVELTRSFDLVGIGVMSNYFDNAAQISEYLRGKISGKIIWGGIHTTLKPEECLDYADLVCVGEGEDALLELVRQMEAGKGVEGIQNIWYKKDGEVVRTPLRLLEHNLDRYPAPDYGLEDAFILHQGKITPLTEDLLMYYLDWPHSKNIGPNYTAMMSRGCTYSCTYCCNNALKNVYQKDWKVRRRSVKNFVNELVEIKRKYPGITYFTIEDDVFLSDLEQVREFCELYKQNLTVPFSVTGFQPSMVSEEKIAMLVDAGMKRVRMGIQTGSVETLHKIYKRPGNQEQLYSAVNALHKFVGNIAPPMYDFIVDNPWETEDQQYETVKFMLTIPRPFTMLVYSLTFYPGTELYERAKKEGYLHDERGEVYRKNFMVTGETYFNRVIRLFRFQYLPKWLYEFLISPRVRKVKPGWIPNLIFQACVWAELIRKGIVALSKGDLAPIQRNIRELFLKRRQARTVTE